MAQDKLFYVLWAIVDGRFEVSFSELLFRCVYGIEEMMMEFSCCDVWMLR